MQPLTAANSCVAAPLLAAGSGACKASGGCCVSFTCGSSDPMIAVLISKQAANASVKQDASQAALDCAVLQPVIMASSATISAQIVVREGGVLAELVGCG